MARGDAPRFFNRFSLEADPLHFKSQGLEFVLFAVETLFVVLWPSVFV
jgi:hypothetical protein